MNGDSQYEVATAMDWSLSKLIRIESGTVGVSTMDLRALLMHYAVTDGVVVRELMELARVGQHPPW